MSIDSWLWVGNDLVVPSQEATVGVRSLGSLIEEMQTEVGTSQLFGLEIGGGGSKFMTNCKISLPAHIGRRRVSPSNAHVASPHTNQSMIQPAAHRQIRKRNENTEIAGDLPRHTIRPASSEVHGIRWIEEWWKWISGKSYPISRHTRTVHPAVRRSKYAKDVGRSNIFPSIVV